MRTSTILTDLRQQATAFQQSQRVMLANLEPIRQQHDRMFKALQPTFYDEPANRRLLAELRATEEYELAFTESSRSFPR